MDMTPIQWILIVLLVLLIAVGIYMLTRKPASGQDRHEEDGQLSTNYGEGGQHVAAGDAGATSRADLYDQEADAPGLETSVEEEPIEAPVWQEDDSLGQDTATGGTIEIVEEEPVISATEDVEPTHAPADPADPADHGDREQMSYGDPQAEDFASETVYAEAPAEDYAVDGTVDSTDDTGSSAHDAGTSDLDTSDPGTDQVETTDVPDTVVADDNDDVPGDAAAAGFPGATGATAMGSQLASDDQETDHTADDVATAGEGDQHESPMDDDHDDPTTENHGPEEGEDGTHDRDAQTDEVVVDDAAVADDRPSDDVVVEEVVVDEVVIVDEPVAADEPADDQDARPDEVVVDDTASADGPPPDDVVVEEVVVDEVVIVDGPVAADEPEADEPSADEAEAAGHDQPQVVMVDVNDYGTGESVQPDHDRDHRESEQHDTDEHHRSEVAEHPAAQEVTRDEPAAEETTYAVVDEDQHLDTGDEHSADETVEEPADEPDPLIEASPYGVGSAIPDDEGQGPAGYEIKGNAGSMLFHTPDSPSYGESTPEVFFENEDAARAAGFAHWDRKRR